MQKVAQAYLQTQVNTTSQGALLLMLYDGAIKFLVQAKEKMAEKDYAKKGILISKAIDIISELDACINIDRGGNISENLHSLYLFCNTRLLTANLRMNQSYIDEVIKILEGLRSAYAFILSPADNATATANLSAQAGISEIAKTNVPVQSSNVTLPTNMKNVANYTSVYTTSSEGNNPNAMASLQSVADQQEIVEALNKEKSVKEESGNEAEQTQPVASVATRNNVANMYRRLQTGN
ncbi:flagellar export chaperone FliS [Desulfovibrio litoralis]|uniref:Flagellar protein FliS n=1 Tax=Desulfovibrio litoralis DSM 11393 TaxID=1121455 RepID=A0A1M7RY08_9BACT|nr:flagellar export chaperone FliS [Desulfovibrio litoralis]SHN51061.1 flagellar protein FliS [Desulfovibrio litoralis DSM 11393]